METGSPPWKRWLRSFQQHWLVSLLVFITIVVISAGKLVEAVEKLYHFARGSPTETVSPTDSITVTLPAGLNLRQALILLAEEDHGVVRFGSTCGLELLARRVRPGALSAPTVRELMNLVRFRATPPTVIPEYEVIRREAGIYDIQCAQGP